MRRLFRWTFNFAAVVSTLLFVATCVLWVRSYRVRDVSWWIPTQSGGGFESALGKVEIGYCHRPDPDMSGVNRRGYYSDSDLRDVEEGIPAFSFRDWRMLGVHVQWQEQWDMIRREVYAHHFHLVLAFLVLPSLGGWRIVRWRSVRSIGHCQSCGYDLRATRASCPECGEVPAA